MQRTNFRLVASVLKFLVRRLGVDYDRALAGLAGVRWPGRCQMLNPRLLVDGGHNPDGLSALAEALHEIFPEEKFTVVFVLICRAWYGFRGKVNLWGRVVRPEKTVLDSFSLPKMP